MVELNALQEVDIKLLRNITKAGDFICAWTHGSECSGLCPECFFHGEETLALYEGSFNLPVVDRRINGAPDIHLDIGAENGVRTGKDVELDFGDSNTLFIVSID